MLGLSRQVSRFYYYERTPSVLRRQRGGGQFIGAAMCDPPYQESGARNQGAPDPDGKPGRKSLFFCSDREILSVAPLLE